MAETQQIQQPDESAQVQKAVQKLFFTGLMEQLDGILAERTSSVIAEIKGMFKSEDFRDGLKKSIVSGGKALMGEEEFLKLAIAAVLDSVTEGILSLFKKMSSDQASMKGVDTLITLAANNEAVHGALSDGVYNGVKRSLQDAEVQKYLSNAGTLMLSSPSMKTVISQALEVSGKNMRDFLKGEEYKGVLSGVGATNVAMMKDAMNVFVGEITESVKKVKISLSGNLE